MKRAILTLAAVLAGVCVASAQTPATYESITVGASAVGLTSTTYAPTGQPVMESCAARLDPSSGELRYRMDGPAPTATEGLTLEPGDVLPLLTPRDMALVQFIRTGATSGTLKVQCWRAPRLIDNELGTTIISSVGADPCLNPNVAKVNVAVTATGQLVALAAGQSVYMCGFYATLGGTNPTIQFQYGTGANCGTGTVNVSGAFAPQPNGTEFFLGHGGTVYTSAVANAFCIALAGTTPTIAGSMSYVQR